MENKPKLKFSRPRSNPIATAISFAGGTRAVARHFKISPQAVYKWKWAQRVPAKHCRELEAMNGGRISRYALNPAVYGPAPEVQP